MSKYYLKHRDKWKRGGRYYRYRPKKHDSYLIINRGTFL